MTRNIFLSPPAVAAVVTLVLIENSHALFASWNDLRENYLPTLLGAVRRANPVVPIPVLWLTTTPVGDDSSSIQSAPPRQYNQLPQLKFSFNPDNKLSSRIINRATELMLEAAAQFQGAPVNLHLFIVAASAPAQGSWGVSITMPSQIGQSEWRSLAQRMAQLGIHCHMILPAQRDMSSLNELFTTTLELQGHTRMSPWFPTSPDYAFLLSGNPSPTTMPAPDLASHLAAADPLAVDPVEQRALLHVARPPVHRHQSFPQDVQSAAAPVPLQNASAPSLVTSLQKVHGLSRKKLYGTQPPRQPFVREEPVVRAKYKSGPTPLSIPTKVERGRRADRPSHVGDVSTSTSPGRRSSWNCVASDVGSSPSSPTTSLSSHHTTSPTIPLYPDLAGYPASPPSTSASFSPTMVSPVPIPDPSFSAPLHDPSGGYFSLSPPPPMSAQGPPWPPMKPAPNPVSLAKCPGTPTAARRHSQELPHGPYTQSLSAMSGKYRLDSVTVEPRGIKGAQKVKDAGDVPFIFSPELEAVTAAKLKAALQSTSPTSGTLPHPFSGFTSGNGLNYALTEDTSCDAMVDEQAVLPVSAPLSYDHVVRQGAMLTNGHDAALVNGNGGADRVALNQAPFGLGSTSSSLQGWAG